MKNTKKLFKKLIKSIKTPIYIAGHINPDHDSIGASIALARILEKQGKTVKVLLDEKDRNILDVHDNHHLVTDTITTPDYCFIAVDLNETYRLGRYQEWYEKASITINIDHHQNNSTNAQLVISEPDKSSTCEIIYNLIPAKYIDLAIASSLYAGIMTDTNCFARRLSPKTMTIAQKLINCRINYESIIRSTFAHRTLYELKALSILTNEIKCTKYFHYLIIDKSRKEFNQLSYNQIVKSISEDLRKICEIDIFIILIIEKDKIIGKCMSNFTKNAHLIAEHFGGGGHKGEAGFSTNTLSVDQILKSTTQFLKTSNKTQ